MTSKLDNLSLGPFYDLSHDLYAVFDTQGNLLHHNPAWHRLLGYASEDLRGLAYFDLIHPDDRLRTTSLNISTEGEFENVREFENRYISNNGRVKWFSWSVNLDQDHQLFYAVGHDITTQKERELELQERYDFLQDIIDSVADPIFIKDDQHCWIKGNRAFCDLMRLPFATLFGKSDHEFFPKEQADIFWENDALVLSTGIENINEEFLTNPVNGELSLLSTKKTRLIDQHGKHILVGIIRDITEKKKMEMALQNKADELSKTNHALSQANRIKDSFISNISHELRTPLTVIAGYSQLLRNNMMGELNEIQKEAMDAIWRRSMEQLHLVNDLLDVSKIEGGELNLKLRPVAITEVLDPIFEALQPELDLHAIRLQCNLPDDFPLLYADSFRLGQVLMNLLGNAVKFTSPEGTVTLSGQHLSTLGFVALTVEDTGIGIPPNEIERIFDRFYQVDASTTRPRSGSGIGLSIVKQLLELQGGTIIVHSEVGKGSRFTVQLPVYADQDLDPDKAFKSAVSLRPVSPDETPGS